MRRRTLWTLLVVLAVAAPGRGQHEHHQHTDAPPPPTWSLADLERRLLERHPALAQAQADVRAAEGRRLQAGLLPNPIVGYTAEDIPIRGGAGDGQHGIFVSQEIPLGGKLRLSRDVAGTALQQAGLAVEREKLRLLAALRETFYALLAAEAEVDTGDRMVSLAQEVVEVTRQLYNTGLADASDQLAVENEAALLQADLAGARSRLVGLWAALAAAVGDPELQPGVLAADLAADLPVLDRGEWHRKILTESPEVTLATLALARAEKILARERAEPRPDLEIEAGVREDRGGPQDGDREVFADVGVRLPLWNRNRGGIAAAEAEVAKARLSADRVRLSLEARFAAAWAKYSQSSQRASAYQNGILDRARKAHQQLLAQYQNMTADYPQVLMAQRTLIQLETDSVRTLGRAWQAAAAIQSLLADEAQMSP